MAGMCVRILDGEAQNENHQPPIGPSLKSDRIDSAEAEVRGDIASCTEMGSNRLATQQEQMPLHLHFVRSCSASEMKKG